MGDPNVVAKWKRALSQAARDTTTDLPYPSGKPLAVREGNEILPLVDGPETYQHIYDAIQTTLGTGQGERCYIYVLAWWMDDSVPLSSASPHSTLNDLLTQAAGEKVEIRILVWKNLFRLASHPRVARRISALQGAACLVDETPNWRSHHQKVVLVKGRKGLIGFCGGLDISSDRIQTVMFHPGSPYHDVHCRVRGAVAYDLLGLFIDRWDAAPSVKKLALDKQTAGKSSLRGRSDRNAAPRDRVGMQWAALARTVNRFDGDAVCAVEYSIRSSLISAIRAARSFIYIEDQYLIDVDLARELNAALKNIEQLIILIPHGNISDMPNVWERRRAFLQAVYRGMPEALLKKIAVCYRTSGPAPAPVNSEADPMSAVVPSDYQPTTLQRELLGPHSYVHAKLWIFDDECIAVGSANCNRRGCAYDSEVMMFIFDAADAPLSTARTLRKRLWTEHLRTSVPDDFRGPALKFHVPPDSSFIGKYDPLEDTKASVASSDGDPALRRDSFPIDPTRAAETKIDNLSDFFSWVSDPPDKDAKPCR